jgi:mono/diheme cytochrome c family protein
MAEVSPRGLYRPLLPEASAGVRACFLILLTSVVACAETKNADPDLEAGRQYVESPAYARAALVASIVNPGNTYSARRLERYSESGWGALPVWNPPAARVMSSAAPDAYTTLDVEAVPWERAALVALGKEAFFAYPLRPRLSLAPLVAEPERFGGHVHEGQRAGLLWVQVPRGVGIAATSCATCHTSVRDGDLLVGVANADLDMGAATGAAVSPPMDPDWGAGLVDVTDDDLHNPVAVPDLRPVKYQTHLHRAGTLRNGLIPLAIRLETLYITSHGEVIRPPRKLMFALALYLHSLAREPVVAPSHPGADVFADRCAGCHGGNGRPGPPVSMDDVGTAQAVAVSPARQTGAWRVPSLVGVAQRGALTASGEFRSLEALLEPDRDGGHLFTQGLGEGERAALRDYLQEY